EEVDAVFDKDAAALAVVPEPVSSAQRLTRGVVFQRQVDQLAEETACRELAQEPVEGDVTHHIVDAQLQAVARDEIEDLPRLRQGRRKRFLDEEALPRLGGADGLWAMQPWRGVQHDDVYLRIAKKIVQVLVGWRVKPLSSRSPAIGVALGDAYDLDLVQTRILLGGDGAEVSIADDPKAQYIFHQVHLRCPASGAL